VKLVIPEEGSVEARTLYDSSTRTVSSRLLLPEACAAVRRAQRTGRLDNRASSAALGELRDLLEGVVPIEVTAAVADDAARIAVAHGLRAYDAIHLASYLRLGAETAVLISADGELVRAASILDLAVAVPGG
jgi:uncharacterized protein